jgi:hypothetical protein
MESPNIIAAEAAIVTARHNLAAVEAKRSEVTTALADAEQRRTAAALPAILGDKKAEAQRLAGIADHASAMALLTDIGTAHAAAERAVAAAMAAVESAKKQSFDEAFAARLNRVLIEHPELAKGGTGSDFLAEAKAAYRWLATVYRRPEVDRSKHLTAWLDAFADGARRLGVSAAMHPAPLLAAAHAHGDIPVINGGETYNTWLGLNLHSGRPAASVPLIGESQPKVAEPPREEPAPVVVRVRDPSESVTINAGARAA